MAQPAGNPFRYGALALDEAFTDREDELVELTADVRNGQDVVIFAPRRFGKSSLVWRAAQQLAGAKVLVGQVDLMRTPTKERLAANLARTIYEDIAPGGAQVREKLGAVFGGLRIRPTATVTDDGSMAFSFSATREDADVDATLEELLALPARFAAERKRPVALVLDEFQEVEAIDRGLPKLMRSVFQEQPEVAHVYLGSKRHMMERIFRDEHEPFWRSAKLLELGPIDAEPFRRHLAERFRRTKRTADEAVLDALLEQTGGHPYATQELAYFLWQEVPEGGTAGPTQLDEALAKVLRSEHAHFGLIWERAASAQRRVLLALAREQPARALSTGYRDRHGLPGASSVQRALEALRRDELVGSDAAGATLIVEPFLAEWIRRGPGSS